MAPKRDAGQTWDSDLLIDHRSLPGREPIENPNAELPGTLWKIRFDGSKEAEFATTLSRIRTEATWFFTPSEDYPGIQETWEL